MITQPTRPYEGGLGTALTSTRLLKPLDAWLLPGLFFGAFMVSLLYSKQGFMPLDSSIVFDGGWRILSGQVPFRDFTAPTGILPSALQAAFFAALGVNWLAYAFHAALFNGLLAAAAFVLLRVLGGNSALAGAYAAATAVVFYPPSGTPFMEQHAFFFSFVAFGCAVAAELTRSHRTQIALIAAIPVLLAAAYFSKQIPTLVLVPAVVVILLTRRIAVRPLLAGLSAGAAMIGLGALAAAALGVRPSLVRTYFFDLPSGTGRERLAELGWMDRENGWAAEFLDAFCCGTMGGWKLVSVELGRSIAWGMVLAAILLAILHRTRLSGAPRWARRGLAALPVLVPLVSLLVVLAGDWAQAPGAGLLIPIQTVGVLIVAVLASVGLFRGVLPPGDADVGLLAGAWCLIAGSQIFTLLTFNHPSNGAALVFIALGIVHVVATGRAPLRARPPKALVDSSVELGGPHAPGSHRRRGERRLTAGMWPRTLLALDLLLFVILAIDVFRFDTDVNQQRAKIAPAPYIESNEPMPLKLSFLSWRIPEWYGLWPSDLTAILDYVRTRPGAFFLVGDLSILYGLTGQPSVNPSLWFHPGLATPLPESPEYEGYRTRLLENFQRYGVTYVIEEPAGTWMGENVDALLGGIAVCSTESVGPFRVRRLC